ncbi:MAG: LuxR C-terminal-related transcriptional regulator [Anaerolineae bacterium]|jgi:LuxR family maltose regulon positive regulatory protein
MISGALLTTKLFVPAPRPDLVPRPQLIQRLDDGLRTGHRLTLLSAPAGFGKTTLLSDWIGQQERTAAWLSLDDKDNEIARFWTYFIAALQTVHAHLGQEPLQLLQSAQRPSVQGILSSLLNEMGALARADPRTDLILVLDDYHLISAPQIHEGMAFLLKHQPHNLHLVVSSRADPPVALPRLRARGQLTELRSDDLRFTSEEAASFLTAVMGLNLTPADVEALETRTEGWIVGLQLAALALQGRADVQTFISRFGGSHHYILEYLTEEVLGRQTEPVRQFLLQTCILDRFCGPLCDSVMGWESPVHPEGAQPAATRLPGDPSAPLASQEMLEQLDHANLFVVPLDDQRRWYRYHRLFADLLRKQLGQQMSSERVAKLQQHASAWHESKGSLDEAVHYALQAEDYGRVVRLVDVAASEGRLESRLTTMLHWLERVPEDMLLRRPRLGLYQAWALVINEQLDAARQVLRKSAEALQSMPFPAETDAVRGELGELLAVVDLMASALAAAYGEERLEKAFQLAHEVRDRALKDGYVFLAGHATNGLAMARFHQGRLSEAAEYYRQLVTLGMQGKASQLPLAAVGKVGLAAICLERNHLDEAARTLEEGLRLGQHRVGTNTLVSAAITQSHLRQYSGDAEGAVEALKEVEQLGHVRDSAPAMHRLGRERAWLKLFVGDLDGADHLVRLLDNPFHEAMFDGKLPASFHEGRQILQARVHLGRGQADLALAELDQLEPAASAAGRFGRIIEICMLKALALQIQGNISAALVQLAHSLELAEPERIRRIYLDEGMPMSALLELFRQGEEAPQYLRDYAQALLKALNPTSGEVLVARAATSVFGMVEPLTRRERQVLQLITAGLSGPEIAEELIVAYSTVRSHIKSIYGKLDVHSRHEAIERAKALGLV